MYSTQDILTAFDDYCAATGLAPSTASTKAANDGKFYDSLKAGKSCTLKRGEKVLSWLREHTPPKDDQPKQQTEGGA